MFIYRLFHPMSARMYIGKTKNSLSRRLACHISAAKKNPQSRRKILCWINALLKRGLSPQIEIIKTVPDKGWQSHEKKWIAFYRDKYGDSNLMNTTPGGDAGGCFGPCNPSRREHISQALKQKYSEETYHWTGKKHKASTRKKMSKWQVGRKLNNEHNKNQANGHRKLTNEQEIIDRFHGGETMTFLAEQFHTSRTAIRRIVYCLNRFSPFFGNQNIIIKSKEVAMQNKKAGPSIKKGLLH